MQRRIGRDLQKAVVGQGVQCWTRRPEVTGLGSTVGMCVSCDGTYALRVRVVVVRIDRRGQHGRDWARHDALA